MMLEPAPCAGDAPRTAPEQGMPAPSPHTPAPRPPRPDRPTRLHVPARDARLCFERERWLGRRSLERQLHDGAALRISALTLQLGLFRHRVPEAEPELHASIDGLQDELHAVLQELREVASKIYPPLLDQAGLGPALREVADRTEVPVRIDAPDDRFGPAAEGAAYSALAECLDAVEAGARPVAVVVRRDRADARAADASSADDPRGDVLAVRVIGIDVRHAEPMLDHVRCLGGTVDVAGGRDDGTIIARIPCE